MELTEAGPGENEALALLHGACFEDSWSAATFAQLLAQPGTFGFLVQAGNAKIGFVIARVVADEAEILTLGVTPSSRGRGVAGRLLAAAAKRVAEKGAKKLFLEVGEANAAALALYRRLGFREVGRRPGYYRGGAANGLIMRADLSSSAVGKPNEVD